MYDRVTTSSKPAALFARLDRALTERADQMFALLPSGPMTCGACRDQMLRLVGVFAKLGLAPGDRALIRSADEACVIPLFLAVLRSGTVPVLADAKATGAECAQICSLCAVRAVFADLALPQALNVETGTLGDTPVAHARRVRDFWRWPSAASLSADRPEPEARTSGATSGTTLWPKAVELTHGNLIAQLDIFERVYRFGPGKRLLNLLALHHVDGLIRGPLAVLWSGGVLGRPMPFSVQAVPAILDTIARESITHFISVPAMLRIIERVRAEWPEAFRVPGFAFVLSSADVLDEALWRRFETRFGVPVVNAYGLSEVVCDALFARPVPTEPLAPTVGIFEVAASCFNVPVEVLSLDSTYFNTEGRDSLADLTLIAAREQAFSIQVGAMQIAQIVSLREASAFVDAQRAKQGA